jgi:hypothetical protein
MMFGCCCKGFLSEYKENVHMGIGRCRKFSTSLLFIPQKSILNRNLKAAKSLTCQKLLRRRRLPSKNIDLIEAFSP